MNWKVWGPLSFTVLIFTVASAIKIFTFNETTVYISVAPELSLWATGVFFSFSISEQALFGVRTVFDLKPGAKPDVLEMSFRFALPGQPEFSPKFTYLFMFCMAAWILNILLTGKADQLAKLDGYISATAGVYIFCSTGLSALTVGMALRAIREVG